MARLLAQAVGVTPDWWGGLNGSTQHYSRTRLALKTKAKIAC